MKKNKELILKEEKGMTLLEILASLVIFAIVFIPLFSFFTQSAIFTKHNEEKLSAIDVAEEVVANARDGAYQSSTTFQKGNYNIDVKIVKGPENTNLRKAIITITSLTNSKVKNPFVTEIYY